MKYSKGIKIKIIDFKEKTMKNRNLKEKLSPEFADLLRDMIYSIEALDEYGDIENLFSSSLWKKVWDAKERAEEILNENGLKEKKGLKESHGFDPETEYLFGLTIYTDMDGLKDFIEDEGWEVDWSEVNKVSSALDFAIEAQVAKEIGHVAVEEFHDDDSYNCTFWVGYDDAKANKYLKDLHSYGDYNRNEDTVIRYDCDEVADDAIDKLEKKFDESLLSALRECVIVEISIPTEHFENLEL